ncbi:MAG: DUF3987 domain-containing protein [Thermodesulfobacteriota bacterium]
MAAQVSPPVRVCDALAYAVAGLPIFPCRGDKSPLTPHGCKDASVDPAQVFTWWERFAPAALGLATGPGSGVWVLDVDAPKPGREADGRDTLAELERQHGPLPATVEQRTGGGGRQLFFAWPQEGPPVRNSASRIGPGLDVRGQGGYVVLPPSLHPSGNRYAWVPGRSPGALAPAEAPSWLLALVNDGGDAPTPAPFRPPAKPGGATAYGQKAMAEELALLAGVGAGQRNDSLNRAAFRLGQLAAGGQLKRAQVEAALLGAARSLGLSEREAKATINSGLEAGQREPRGPTDSAPIAMLQTWPELVPFDSFEPQPLPVGVLPGWARDFVLAAAEHLQVASCLVLANVLGAVATITARVFRMEVRPGYQEPLNLYLLAPAPPAERKTGTQAICLAPLYAWERERSEAMAGQINEARSRRKSQEAVIAGLRTKLGKAKPDERERLMREIASLEMTLPEVPQAPRLLADDITAEALAALMADHDQCLGIASAEGGLFDTLAGRYSNGVPNLDLVLKAHAGEPVRVDRKNAPPIIMNSPALTLCLSPQPEVVSGLMGKPGFRGRGLLGRFAYILPQTRLGRRMVDAPPIPQATRRAFDDALRRLLDLPWTSDEHGEPAAHVLHLERRAYLAWVEFAEAIEPELAEGGSFEGVRDWAGKLPGLAARLAGNLHAMEHLERATGLAVAESTMARALDLAAALAGHALAAFGMMGADHDVEAAKRVLAWIRRDHIERFTMREAHRAVRGLLQKAEQVRAALSILEERGHVLAEPAPKTSAPGRPASPSYIVNPKALAVV